MRARIVLGIVMLVLGTGSLPASADFIGPLPYLAFDHPDAGSAVSPFRNLDFAYFHLEDFEDGALNTPGVLLVESSPSVLTGFTADSVDGDDGTVDGFGGGTTHSLFSGFAATSMTFMFLANELGELPTHAGLVFTDVGRNGGGFPVASDLVDNTYFEAFGLLGESLGMIGPFSLGDDSIYGTTDEDRFFGIVNLDGISAIRISMPDLDNWEIDHLQYGSITVVPEASSMVMMATAGLSMAGYGLMRKRCIRARS